MTDDAEKSGYCYDYLQNVSDYTGWKYEYVYGDWTELLHIQMPNMNGYEATKMIRRLSDERKAGIPILAMTANAFEEDKENALAAAMNGYLAKPINVTG